MSSNISSKSTIAKNTTLLYGRTVLIMIVTLYTSRVVLQALGVEDYGVYTAIGGVVSLLTVVIGPIDSAISRFLTYELGRGDQDKLKKYFSTGLTIMVLFSVLSIVVLETVGLWFLNNKMVVDSNRLIAANWVLHLSIAAFVVNIISSPYRAAIIAHERMSLFAYMGILDAILKLAVAFLLKISGYDKLIIYAVLLLLVSMLVRFIYTIICNKEFEECRKVKLSIEKELFGGLFSFAGWNMFGAAASVCRGQGINILFNLFGGPIVNAAFGIANQVNSAVGTFINNFTTALNPSIIKSYASSQNDYMMSLVYQGAKYSYFLVLLFALPLLLETEYITQLWLGQTPDFSVPFIQMMLIYTLIDAYSKTIMAGVHASGNIKMYQFVIGSLQVLLLPLAYILLKVGLTPIFVLFAMVVIDVVALFVRMIMARGIFSLSIIDFVKKVLFITLLTTLIAIPLPMFFRMIMPQGLVRFVIVICLSLITTIGSVLLFGCTKTERTSIFSKMKQVRERISRS